MSGEEIADIFVGGRTYDVQLWTTPEKRHSLESIENMLIDTPTGKYVALKDVADVRLAPSPNLIKRTDGSRTLEVQANVARGVELASVAQEVEHRLQQVSFPLGYTAVLQGEYIELRQARANLALYSALAAVCVLLLLQLCFNSWRLAFLSFLTLPFALVGGILLSIPAGGILSLGSLVGFLSVLGIAARNGIMMINHFQHLEREEGETFGLNLVLRGARERLTPILMTTGATALAILPLVIYGNLPGHEIEYPMAIVILGGLVTSTLLNLFVLPALYLRVSKASSRGIVPAT
jgi:Cu/Ag efflux pump CusA